MILLSGIGFFRTASGTSSFGGGFFSFFKGLAGQKAITKDAMAPVLDKMREHLCCEFFLFVNVS